jgi:alpha-tubulin suppressor-like RCC1 family protein
MFLCFSAPLFALEGSPPSSTLVAGGYHNCALRNGQVYCWGYGLLGQLGQGQQENESHAVLVSGLGNDVTQVAAGEMHSCAVKKTGEVYCWGFSYTGAVGNGQSKMNTGFASYMVPTSTLQPTRVQGLTGIKITQIAAAKNSSCALSATGDVYCWGAGSEFQLGDQKSGITNHSGTARRVTALTSKAKSIHAAENGFCAITTNQQLTCWGFVVAASQRTYPVTDVTPNQLTVKSLALGDGHSCFVDANQKLYCIGDNWYQQTGLSSTATTWTPVGNESWRSVDTYKKTSCGITSTGQVKCWGLCLYGLCGDASKSVLVTPTQGQDVYRFSSQAPLTIPGVSNALEVAVGARHACALLSTGSIKCWGSGFLGQLGQGSSEQTANPVTVNFTNGTDSAAWWNNMQVTPGRLQQALDELAVWSQQESRKSIYYSQALMALPLDGGLRAINKNNYNNIYGYGYFHWILRKSAKFLQLLYPDRSVTVLRVNTNYPYSNPQAQEDAHHQGLDADLGYILEDPNDPTSPIDLEAQFWFTYMIYSEASKVTGHRYSGFSYIHEMESYLHKAKAEQLVDSRFTFTRMTDPWEFYHVSHFHFGINPCTGSIQATAEGPRCR